MDPAKIKNPTKGHKRVSRETNLVPQAPRGERAGHDDDRNRRSKSYQLVPDKGNRSDGHADPVQKQAHRHGFLRGYAQPEKGRNNGEGRPHPAMVRIMINIETISGPRFPWLMAYLSSGAGFFSPPSEDLRSSEAFLSLSLNRNAEETPSGPAFNLLVKAPRHIWHIV